MLKLNCSDKRAGFALLAAGLMLASPAPCSASANQVTAIEAKSLASDRLIEDTMRAIGAAKKPLPFWAIDMALRAYQVYKTYRNGQKVEEVQREVLVILKIVAELKDQADAGLDMSEREHRLTRDLLGVHGRMVEDLTVRAATLEHKTSELATQVAFWRKRAQELERRLFRRGCGVGHAWRNGSCVDVAANQR